MALTQFDAGKQHRATEAWADANPHLQAVRHDDSGVGYAQPKVKNAFNPPPVQATKLCLGAIQVETCQEDLLRQQVMDMRHLYVATGETAMGSSLRGLGLFPGDEPLSPERLKQCTDLNLAQPSAAPLWREAAEKGSAAAMWNYAVGNGFKPSRTLLDAEEYKIYFSRAPVYARQIARSGDFLAIVALASAHAPQSDLRMRSLLSQAVGIDRLKSMALYRVAEQAIGVNGKGKEGVKDLIDTRIRQLELLSSAEEIRESVVKSHQLSLEWGPINVPASMEHVDLFMLNGGQAMPVEEAECRSR